MMAKLGEGESWVNEQRKLYISAGIIPPAMQANSS